MEICLEKLVLNYFQVETIEEAEKALYGSTECGAWLKITNTKELGPVFSMGSIIEDCEAEVGPYEWEYLQRGSYIEGFNKWATETIENIESEVDEIRHNPDLYDPELLEGEIRQEEMENVVMNEKDIHDKIASGAYETLIPYPEGDRQENREEFLAFLTIRNKDKRALNLVFRADLEKVFPTKNQDVKDNLWRLAWDNGHSSGFTDILYCYSDYYENFVKPLGG